MNPRLLIFNEKRSRGGRFGNRDALGPGRTLASFEMPVTGRYLTGERLVEEGMLLNDLSREKTILSHIKKKKKAKQIFILRVVELKRDTWQLGRELFLQ